MDSWKGHGPPAAMYAFESFSSTRIATPFFVAEGGAAAEWLQDEDGRFTLSMTEENTEVLHVKDTGRGPESITRPECAERALPSTISNPILSFQFLFI